MEQKIAHLEAAPFLDFLHEWVDRLPGFRIQQAAPEPERAAILSVDITNGFCYEGPLSSPRVAQIVAPTARLFQQAWDYGIHNIVLLQDTHEPDAVEFAQWPPHCVRGTTQCQTVPEITALPFYPQMVTIPKNSIQSALNTAFPDWLAQHAEVDTFIVVGDCTDLCTYQLAMFLRVDANARQIKRRVIVPVDCVNTYDLPVDVAEKIGIFPHPGDLLHEVFLYHMALNGVEVAQSITNV